MNIYPRRVSSCGATLLGLLTCLYAAPGACKTLVTVYAPASRPPTARAESLPVFMIDEVAPRPVRVLASLRMEALDPPNLTADEGELRALRKDALRKAARPLGADAVAGVYEVRRRGSSHRTVYALAVAYRDSTAAPDSCGCLVVLPLPRLRFAVPQEWRRDVANELRAKVAEELALKGYYAFMTLDSLAPGAWPASAAAFRASGLPADNVFEFTLAQGGPDPEAAPMLGSSLVSSVPLHAATAHINAALVSARGDTLWNTSVSRPTDPLTNVRFSEPGVPMTDADKMLPHVHFSWPDSTTDTNKMTRYLHDALVPMPGTRARGVDKRGGR